MVALAPAMPTTGPDVVTMPKTSAGRVLLPWQEAWRRDTSRLKIWEKSRRIGATFTEANDAVMTRATGDKRSDYWFSSADESAAFEFAEYCRFWSKTIGQVVEIATDAVEDPKTGRAAQSFRVVVNGRRITAMSSSPRRFRSKGGDVCLDEFGYHDEAGKMWDAAGPTMTWGDQARILSTHNGEGTAFHSFVQQGKRVAAGEGKKGDMPWSVHVITIIQAIEQGIVEKINDMKGTSLTREGFLADCRASCRTEDAWLQEFLAIPSRDSNAWLTYQLIEQCEDDTAGDPSRYGDGPRYIGMDIGESGDRTVIWTLERVGDVLLTREVLTMTDEPLATKQDALLSRMAHPKVVRAAVDGTGLGTQIGQAAEKTGKGESIKFSLASKDELASPLRGVFEDRSIRVPGDYETREDLHKIRMTAGLNGRPRFDAPRTGDGHADRFWALALAVYAGKTRGTEPRIGFLETGGGVW